MTNTPCDLDEVRRLLIRLRCSELPLRDSDLLDRLADELAELREEKFTLREEAEWILREGKLRDELAEARAEIERLRSFADPVGVWREDIARLTAQISTHEAACTQRDEMREALKRRNITLL